MVNPREMTESDVARALALLDGRRVVSGDDRRIATIVVAQLATISDEEFAAAEPVAAEFLATHWRRPEG